MLSFSQKKSSLSAAPKKKPYMTIKLPIPRQIVPWDADPITVSDSSTESSAATTPRLSTLTILRYDFQDGDAPEMTALGQPTWKPKPIPYGTERVLVIAVTTPKAQTGEEEHKPARDAFDELAKVLGLNLKIDFPSVPYTRNQPLNPGVLPDETPSTA